MTHPFDVNSFQELVKDDFTDEFIFDLHRLVGVDAVTEFGEILQQEREDLFPEYLNALRKYYDKRREESE